jgi:multidrug transporter EmrE-like cation transporter
VISHWTLILLAAAANVVLNHSLRQTSRGADLSSLRAGLASVFLSPWALLAVVSGTILVGAFMVAIRYYPLSLTYTAVTALAMVALTTLGVVLQQEQASLGRVVGLALIIAGLVVTARAA